MKYIPVVRGKELDILANSLGLIRQRRWWFIKESDKSLRERVSCRICQLSNKKLSVLGVKVC